jgi:GxxExxY protein
MEENSITSKIINSAIELHKYIGPGLLESAYETFLVHELMSAGMEVKNQVLLHWYTKT